MKPFIYYLYKRIHPDHTVDDIVKWEETKYHFKRGVDIVLHLGKTTIPHWDRREMK